MIEIKHRFNGNVLYTAESAQDVRTALEEAVKQGADLRRADLRGAINSPDHPLHAIRADMWSILDQAPAEVSALREAMAEGRINGSVYCDESGCGCLSGTIGISHGGTTEAEVSTALDELGIVQDGSRPAEQWVIPIVKGDKPLPLDTKEWPSESAFRLSHAFAWTEEWLASRKKIAEALA